MKDIIHLRKPGTGDTYCGLSTRLFPALRAMEVDQFSGKLTDTGCDACWHKFSAGPCVSRHPFAGRKRKK